MQQAQSVLTFSDRIYQRMLNAYPVEYRQKFSDEMAQVFRDLCREIYKQKGLAGFLGLWLATLFDLIKTAFEERFKETTNMTKEKFTRLKSWGLMLAGVTMMLGFAAGDTDAAYFDSPNDPLSQYNFLYDPIGGPDALSEVAPIILILAGMLFFAVGINGLQLRYGVDSGSIGNLSLQISTIAGIVGFIAIIPMFLGIELWWGIFAYSLLIAFTGLSVFGVTAMKNRSLPRWNGLPLLVSIWFPVIFLAEQFGYTPANDALYWNLAPWLMIISTAALGYMLLADTEKGMEVA